MVYMTNRKTLIPAIIEKTQKALDEHLSKVKDFSELEEFMIDKRLSVLVSGQRFDNYKKLETKLTILRPLVTYTKEEAKKLLKEYDRD